MNKNTEVMETKPEVVTHSKPAGRLGWLGIVLVVIMLCMAATYLFAIPLTKGVVEAIKVVNNPLVETNSASMAEVDKDLAFALATKPDDKVDEEKTSEMPKESAQEVMTKVEESSIPLPENFPSNYAEMTQDEQEVWVTGAFFGPEFAGQKLFTRVEETDGMGTGFVFQSKDVGVNEVPCTTAFACHFDLEDGNVVYAYNIVEKITGVVAGTVRIPAIIQLVEKIDLCTLYYKAWTFDASNGIEVQPLGDVAKCSQVPERYSELVDPEIGQRVTEMSQMTGVSVISVGHIADGLGVFVFYSGDMKSGDLTLTCPNNVDCFVTRSNESWVKVEGAGQEIPGVVGAYFFDTKEFLNNAEIMEFAHQLMGDNISVQ